MSVIATSLYTFSVWQKNVKVYKYLGIPMGILWISYNIYIMSIVELVLESALFISVLISIILSRKKNIIDR